MPTESPSQAAIVRKKVFTTGNIAEICGVAPRTVSKWFDAGRIKGWRIPGSRDRRIPRENLIKFMKDSGIPVEWLHAYEWAAAAKRQPPAGAVASSDHGLRVVQAD